MTAPDLGKIDAANAAVGLGNTIAIGTVSFGAHVYAFKQFTGPVRYLYGGLAVAQGFGLLALSVAQGATLYVSRNAKE